MTDAVAINVMQPAGDTGTHPCPPVLILNLFYSGLAIARDLAGRGIRVVGLSAHRDCYGNSTRFCEVRFAPNSQEEPEQLAEFLLKSAPELAGAIIFPTRDADVLFLDDYRERLQEYYRLAIPPRDTLLRVIDKDVLVQTAIQAGLPVPRTMVINHDSELERVPSEVGFPCVLKPVRSVDWRGGNTWQLVGGQKAFRAEDAAELRQQYERLARVRAQLMIQEWIPGGVDQIVVMGGYVNEHSESLAYFTARKIVQEPEDFGTGCVVESCDIPALPELTCRLWRALRYQGMAEVEYKRDPRDGRFKLIEMNTRHWDWHQLGQASGINLTEVAYRHLSGNSAAFPQPQIQRAKWVAEDALFMFAVKSIYQRKFHFLQLWRQLSGRRMYGISSFHDPLPSLVYFCRVVLPGLARSVAKKIVKGGAKS